ncbi:MAG TPA: DUF2085 domain-containing protein [Anaerolineales bacterium]|jgi:uncharacterized membrane protein|nr:DUF2085 domain-containing protein [Anaerolineales bacterium]
MIRKVDITKHVAQKNQKALMLPRSKRLIYWISQNWIVVFTLLMGIYVGLPFLAPVFMQVNWTRPARAIYLFYSFQCHQLPQRSFFLFGPKFMYSLGDVKVAWQNTINPAVLRQFIGNPQMGWKVAWSDRMVYMYASTLISGLLWWSLHHRLRRLPWWGLALFLLPMFVDGSTHLLSDLAGLGQGFRYTNAWLASLTHNAFPPSFYIGNALASFNSWMRLISGVLFGIGVVWFGFPYLNEWFEDTVRIMDAGF